MKKLIFLLALASVLITGNAFAQGYNYNSFVYSPAGVINNAVAPSFYTKLDTVTNTAVDTFGTAMDPFRNSVGFQINVLKISGDPEGGYFQLWGTKEASQSGGYTLISTDTVRDISRLQVFNHEIGTVTNAIDANGVITITSAGSSGGNPYRYYMLTYNGVTNSVVSWKSIAFIR